MDDEHGLDLYYFGVRYHDPVAGRFISVDPMADKYPGLSPYNYTMNNPLILVDPDGKRPMTKEEHQIIMNAMRTAEKEFRFKQGEQKKQYPDISVPIEGIEMSGEYSGGPRQVYETGMAYGPAAGDPSQNILHGQDTEYGGDIEVFVSKPENMNIKMIKRDDRHGTKGDENSRIILCYYNSNDEVKGLAIIKLSMTIEQYNVWIKQWNENLHKGQESRDKEEEEKEN